MRQGCVGTGTLARPCRAKLGCLPRLLRSFLQRGELRSPDGQECPSPHRPSPTMPVPPKSLFRLRAGVAHVEDYFPVDVFLFLPDAGVLAVIDDSVAVFIFRAKLKRAVGVAEIARGGNVGADRSPGQAVVFVVEKAH